MDQAKILVVDDDDTFRTLLAAELAARGFRPAMAAGAASALAMIAAEDFDVALIDLKLPDGDGLAVMRQVQAQKPRIEVIILTGHGSIDTALEAMRAGAFDYLRKPCLIDELDVTIRKALERQSLIEHNSILRDGLAPPDLGTEFIGGSPLFQDLCAVINRVAATDSAVLITGETGVGKEVVAKLIHARSPRGRQPLVVVECAALHEDLLRSELFGHEKGAYTGASHLKHGLFEVADHGAIFLDEIGEVSLATQVALLRVLETGRFRRVGGTREIAVNIRVLAATNRNLAQMIDRGYFRKDLFYRLSTIRIEVPPLRERPQDIDLLLDHFLARLNARIGQQRKFSPAARAMLRSYPWPGNARELLHVIERAVVLGDGEVIEEAHLPHELRGTAEPGAGQFFTLRELERQHIVHVVGAVQGNRSQAAALLGVSERTLYRKLREYGLAGLPGDPGEGLPPESRDH